MHKTSRVVFFFDNNVSQHLAAGMKAFQEQAIHLVDEFSQDTKDTDWIPVVGSKGWTLITRDERILKNPAELKAYKENNIGAFFLGGKNRSRCDLIRQLVRNWPQMKELAAKTRKPFAFRVPPSGGKFKKILLK